MFVILRLMFSIDQKFPDFSLEAYLPGKDDIVKLALKDFAGEWLILFFYPADFTFVCPTELADIHKRYAEFKKYRAEVLAVSTDTVYTHKAWLEAEALLKGIIFPMAADHNGKLSRELGIYDETTGRAQRVVFIIDPKGILRAMDMVSDEIGRSAGEILRKLKALYFVDTNPGRVCPASWDEGDATLTPSIKIAGKVYEQLNKSGKGKK